jgi:hypothetical protein
MRRNKGLPATTLEVRMSKNVFLIATLLFGSITVSAATVELRSICFATANECDWAKQNYKLLSVENLQLSTECIYDSSLDGVCKGMNFLLKTTAEFDVPVPNCVPRGPLQRPEPPPHF